MLGTRVERAQDPQEAAHLGQGFATGHLDRAEGFDRAVGIAIQHAPGRARLHHHYADAVGHDVVQLACDARPLLGNRLPLVLAPLSLELLGAGAQLATQCRPGSGDAPDRPGDPEDAGREEPVVQRRVV